MADPERTCAGCQWWAQIDGDKHTGFCGNRRSEKDVTGQFDTCHAFETIETAEAPA